MDTSLCWNNLLHFQSKNIFVCKVIYENDLGKLVILIGFELMSGKFIVFNKQYTFHKPNS